MNSFDLLSKRKTFICVGAIILIVAVIASFALGIKMDLQFKSGTQLKYTFSGEQIDVELMKTEITNSTDKAVFIEIGNGYATIFSDKSNALTPDDTAKISDALDDAFEDNEVTLVSVKSTIKGGSSILIKNIIFLAVAVLVIIVFTAFLYYNMGSFGAGVACIAGAIVDISASVIALVIVGGSISSYTFGLALVLIGLSASNMLIILKQIKQNSLKAASNNSYEAIVNQSVDEVKNKIILFTVILAVSMAVIAIVFNFVSGVPEILAIAVPAFVGIVVSAFSGICVSPSIFFALNKDGKDNL